MRVTHIISGCGLHPADDVPEGAIAPANTPAGPCAPPEAGGAGGQVLSSYQLMLAHIVGGHYVSPTLGRPGSPGTPPAQRGRSFTPCLLATPAGAPPASCLATM
jgi:hypothetical protein